MTEYRNQIAQVVGFLTAARAAAPEGDAYQVLRARLQDNLETASMMLAALSQPRDPLPSPPPASTPPEESKLPADWQRRATQAMEQRTTGSLITGSPTPLTPETGWQFSNLRDPDPKPRSREDGGLPPFKPIAAQVLERDSIPYYGNEWWGWTPSEDPKRCVPLPWHTERRGTFTVGHLDRPNRLARFQGESHGFVRRYLTLGDHVYENLVSMPEESWAILVRDPAVKWLEWEDRAKGLLYRVDWESAQTNAVAYHAQGIGQRIGIPFEVFSAVLDRNGYEVDKKGIAF